MAPLFAAIRRACPCMRPSKSSTISRHSLLLHFSFFVQLGIPFLRPDPHVLEVGARRGCQGRPSLCAERGARCRGTRGLAPQPCIRWVAMTRTMMHACASAAKLRGGGPILNGGIEARDKRGTPPPRTVIASPSRTSGRERSHNPFAKPPAVLGRLKAVERILE